MDNKNKIKEYEALHSRRRTQPTLCLDHLRTERLRDEKSRAKYISIKHCQLANNKKKQNTNERTCVLLLFKVS